MLSRNNWKEQVRQQEPKKQRFTIKKLTIGVASVLIGFTFMGMSASANGQNTPGTPAGTNQNANPSVQPAQSGTDSKAITADSGQPNNAQNKQSNNNANPSVQPAQSGTDSKAITADSGQPNNAQNKQSNNNANPSVQPAQSGTDSKAITADSGQPNNAQNKQSNVDLSLWKWQTADSTKGYNGIKLTGYTGAVDENATIYVPNNVDFIKAGKIKAGQFVYLDDLSDIRNCRRLIIDNHDGGKVIFVRNPTGSIPTFTSETLEYIDVSGADTHLLTDMSGMFSDSPNLKRIVGLENFDTSHVQSFELMFGLDPQLMDIDDLSKWDVSKVENFNEMFQWDKNLTNIGNLDNWDVSQAKSFEMMFMGTKKLESIGSLKDWQVKNVTDMGGMFLLSSIVGVDMSNWDVSSLRDASYMFAYNYNPRFTNLELPNFSKAKLGNWLHAFLDDNYLENINISGWDFVDDLINKQIHDAHDGADNLFDKWLSTSGVNGLTVNTIGAKWPSDLDLMPKNSDFDYNPKYGVTDNGINRFSSFEGLEEYTKDIKYSEKPTPLVVLTDNQTLLGYNKQRSNRPNEITLVDKNGKVIGQYQMPIFYTSIDDIKKQISQYEDEFTQKYPKATFTFTLVDPETHQELTKKQIEKLTPAQLVMATYLVRQNAKATVDKSQLQKDIDQGTQIKQNDKYRNADVDQQKALDDAIKNGQDVLKDPKADQKKVDDADKAITDALNGLKGQPTDKSQLQKDIDQGTQIKQNDKYRNADVDQQKALDDAIKNGQDVLKDPKADQKKVDDADKAITDALNGLKGQPTDKSQLQKDIDQGTQIKQNDKYRNADVDQQKALDDAIKNGQDVLKDPKADQKKVDDADKAITDALNGLKGQPTDKSQLQKDIDQGTQIKQNDKYRNADVDQQKALDDAIKNGQDVLKDPKADQKKVDDADKAITDALNGLKGQPTDKSQLQKDIDQGTQIKQNDKYRNADVDQQKALDDAIKNGQDVLKDPKADQKKVDDADKAITDALNGLKGQPTDKSQLQKDIDQGTQIKQNDKYRNADVDQQKALDDAIKNGQDVLKDPKADQKKVDDADKAITDALNGLKGQPTDKSQLQKDIDQGTQIKQNDKYRNADVDQQKALDDAIKNGQDVLKDPKADQKKVDDADKAITDALNGLKGQPTDKSQLQKDIDQGTQIKQNDKYRNADVDQQKALDDAIKNGQDVLKDPKADQKKVDDADKAITDALNGLKGQPTDKSQLQKDIDQGTQIKQNDKYRNADVDQQKALDDAIKNGQDVLKDPKADQKKVDDADKAITDALNGLKGQPTDKSQLQKDIDQGTQIKQNDKYRNADVDQQKALDDAIKNGQDVLKDPKADQKKVDDADKAITDALNGLKGQPTDKSQLQKDIDQGTQIKQNDKYRNADVDQQKALDNAIKNGQDVLKDPKADQKKVDDADKAITDALNGLKGQPTDKSQLQKDIDQGTQIKQNDKYRNADVDQQKALDDAIKNGQDVLKDPKADQKKVDDADKAITDALNGLKGQPTDKSQLQKDIDQGTQIKQNDKYRNADVDQQKALDDAIKNGQDVLKDPKADQKKVDDADKAITDALNGLKGQPTDKSQLQKDIDQGTQIKQNDKYRNADVDQQKALDDAIKNGQDVLKDPKADQKKVDDADKAITDALNGLKGQPTDKSQLQKDIDQGTQIKQNDKYRNADVDQQKALDDAIKNGQDVLKDPKADQKKVDDADKAITDALNGLKGQPTTPTKPDDNKSNKPVTPTNPAKPDNGNKGTDTPVTPSKPNTGKDDNNKGNQPTNPTTPTKPDDNKSNKPVTPTNPAKPDNGNKGTDTPVTPSKPNTGKDDNNKGDQPTNPTTPTKPDDNKSNKPVTPTNPAKPDNGNKGTDTPVTPSKPNTGKDDNNKGNQPTNPTTPTKPDDNKSNKPVTPTNPAKPDNGNKGTDTPVTPSKPNTGKDDNNKGDQPTNPTTPTKPDDNKSNKPVTPTNPAKPDNGNKGTDTPVTPSKPNTGKDDNNKGDQPTNPTTPTKPDDNKSNKPVTPTNPAKPDNGNKGTDTPVTPSKPNTGKDDNNKGNQPTNPTTPTKPDDNKSNKPVTPTNPAKPDNGNKGTDTPVTPSKPNTGKDDNNKGDQPTNPTTPTKPDDNKSNKPVTPTNPAKPDNGNKGTDTPVTPSKPNTGKDDNNKGDQPTNPTTPTKPDDNKSNKPVTPTNPAKPDNGNKGTDTPVTPSKPNTGKDDNNKGNQPTNPTTPTKPDDNKSNKPVTPTNPAKPDNGNKGTDTPVTPSKPNTGKDDNNKGDQPTNPTTPTKPDDNKSNKPVTPTNPAKPDNGNKGTDTPVTPSKPNTGKDDNNKGDQPTNPTTPTKPDDNKSNKPVTPTNPAKPDNGNKGTDTPVTPSKPNTGKDDNNKGDQPTNPTTPTKPDDNKSNKPVTPTNPAKPDNGNKGTDTPVTPSKPNTGKDDNNKGDQPTNPTTPTKPDDNKSNKPVTPTNPAKPDNGNKGTDTPVTPSKPNTGKDDNNKGNQPTNPTTPTKPDDNKSNKPVTPTNPAKPDNGNKGTDTPVTPSKPNTGKDDNNKGDQPTNPTTPTKPDDNKSNKPVTPTNPAKPDNGNKGTDTPVTPSKPTDNKGDQPTTPTIPAQPDHGNASISGQAGHKPATSDNGTQNGNGNKTVNTNVTDNGNGDNSQNNKQALPQTGNTKNDAAVAGLGLAGLLAMLGLGGLKKKRN